MPTGPKAAEMLGMEPGEPLAYTEPADPNIYVKYSHYISATVALPTYSHFVTNSQEPILCQSEPRLK